MKILFNLAFLAFTSAEKINSRNKRNLVPILENQDGVAPAGSRESFLEAFSWNRKAQPEVWNKEVRVGNCRDGFPYLRVSNLAREEMKNWTRVVIYEPRSFQINKASKMEVVKFSNNKNHKMALNLKNKYLKNRKNMRLFIKQFAK